MSPRQKFIEKHINDTYVDSELLGYIYDAMQLASSHDPDLVRWIKMLEKRIETLERRCRKQIGANSTVSRPRKARPQATTFPGASRTSER